MGNAAPRSTFATRQREGVAPGPCQLVATQAPPTDDSNTAMNRTGRQPQNQTGKKVALVSTAQLGHHIVGRITGLTINKNSFVHKTKIFSGSIIFIIQIS